MKKKLRIGELVSIHFKDRKAPIFGIVEGVSEEWILLKYNVVDFIIDGYTIVKRANITEIRRGPEEKFREKVIKLKGAGAVKFAAFGLANLSEILNQLNSKFGAFELRTKSGGKCYIGRVKLFDIEDLVIYALNPNGRWGGQFRFKINDIGVIQFDTDYVNSLKLLASTK